MQGEHTDPADQANENTAEQPADDPDAGGGEVTDDEPSPDENEPDAFPRSYVEQLRSENQRYRERGKRADGLARRLHTELVRSTGRLADPTDLPFDENHIDDAGMLTAAIDDLLTRKPHLATRRPFGDIGQGPTPPAGTVDLAGILRAKAR